MEKLTIDDVTIVSLRDLKIQDASQFCKVLDTLVDMKRADADEGASPQEVDKSCKAYRKWIEDNVSQPNTNYDTYVFLDKKTQKIAATGSIIRDDQELGKQYSIPGLWTGGWRVNKNYRGRKLSNLLVDHLDAHVQRIADKEQQTMQVNFFTENPASEHLGNTRGYKSLGTFHIEYFNADGKIYSKTIPPTS